MKYLVNGLISGIILIVFERIGWIAFPNPPSIFTALTLNILLIAFIVGFLVGVIMTIVGKLYGILVVFTCLIGLIALPFFLAAVGYFSLWIVSKIFPDWISITTGAWWKNLILSLILGWIRYHNFIDKKRKKS